MLTCDNSRVEAAWWSGIIEPDDIYASALRIALGDAQARQWVCADQPGPLPTSLMQSQIRWERMWQRWHPRVSEWDIEAELVRAERYGIRYIVDTDEEWPHELDVLDVHSPRGLWVQGELTTALGVSIVGARACTTLGGRNARDVACEMASRGWTVISGGAFGIDIAAHQGALAANGRTIAVLAGGLLNRYPQAHNEHFEDILANGGALVAEVPPTWRPAKWRFLGRNRLISAWGRGTLVVEAGLRSGALATARRAMEIGRPVGAMPGSLASASSEGCHELIRNGATLIRDGADMIEMCDSIGSGQQETLFGAPVVQDRGHEALAPDQRRVWEALPVRSGASLPRVVRAAGLGERDVLIALAELELNGWVESCSAGWRRRR